MAKQTSFGFKAGPLFERRGKALPPAPKPARAGRRRVARKAALPAAPPLPLDAKAKKAAHAAAKHVRAQERSSLKTAKEKRLAEYQAQLMRLGELSKQLKSWMRRARQVKSLAELKSTPQITKAATRLTDIFKYA